MVWPGLQTPLSGVDPKMQSGFPELSHTGSQSSFNWEGQAVPVRSPQRPPLLWTQAASTLAQKVAESQTPDSREQETKENLERHSGAAGWS